MSWFTDNVLGVMSLVGTGLGAFGGAIWWMSALYSEVKRINTTLSDYMSDQKEQNVRVWGAIDGIDSRLDEHDRRITTIETKIE